MLSGLLPHRNQRKAWQSWSSLNQVKPRHKIREVSGEMKAARVPWVDLHVWVFTGQMTDLLYTEKELVQSLRDYIKAEESKLAAVKRYSLNPASARANGICTHWCVSLFSTFTSGQKSFFDLPAKSLHDFTKKNPRYYFIKWFFLINSFY